MFCRNCGSENGTGKKKCFYCGSKLTFFKTYNESILTKICVQCGTQNAAEREKCFKCGVQLQNLSEDGGKPLENQTPSLSEKIEQSNNRDIEKSFENSVLEKMEDIYHDLHFLYIIAVLALVIGLSSLFIYLMMIFF